MDAKVLDDVTGEVVASNAGFSAAAKTISVPAGGNATTFECGEMRIGSAQLWSVEDPHLVSEWVQQ